MKELPDDRTSGVVGCLLVVHAPSVIGGNRTMDVDRSVVHAPSLGKSMKRPQSSQWVAFVRGLLLRVFPPSLRRDYSSASSSRKGCMFHERGVHKERGVDGPIAILMKM